MRVSSWAYGGVPDGCSIKRQQGLVAQTQVVESGEFHDEIVRVLTVHDGPSKSSFSLLKQFWIVSAGHSCRFKAQHGADSEGSWTQLTLCHWHKPVAREDLVRTTRGALLQRIQESFAVEHEHPTAP